MSDLTQDEFDTIERIAKEHSGKPFAYLTKEDLYSEIWVICLQALPEFDPSGHNKLEHFLRVSVRNRLVNLYKEKSKSVRSPCSRCEFYDPGGSPSNCAKFGEEFMRCDKWRNYLSSVERRNALLNAIGDPCERPIKNETLDSIFTKELAEIMSDCLSPDIYADLIKVLEGEHIPKNKEERLRDEIRGVLSVMRG